MFHLPERKQVTYKAVLVVTPAESVLRYAGAFALVWCKSAQSGSGASDSVEGN